MSYSLKDLITKYKTRAELEQTHLDHVVAVKVDCRVEQTESALESEQQGAQDRIDFFKEVVHDLECVASNQER